MAIAWTSDLETGNDTIDSQHRQLIETLNELIESCASGIDAEKLRDTLDFLVQYTVRHFDDEEMLQFMHMYPDFDKHRQLHDNFKKTVADLVRRYEESGSSEELSNDVNKIVAAWFLRHIRMEDKKIGTYLRDKKAVSKKPGTH